MESVKSGGIRSVSKIVQVLDQSSEGLWLNKITRIRIIQKKRVFVLAQSGKGLRFQMKGKGTVLSASEIGFHYQP